MNIYLFSIPFVLVAVDQINALYTKTDYYHPNGEALMPHELYLVKPLVDLFNGSRILVSSRIINCSTIIVLINDIGTWSSCRCKVITRRTIRSCYANGESRGIQSITAIYYRGIFTIWGYVYTRLLLQGSSYFWR
jgi:hypothetical protein